MRKELNVYHRFKAVKREMDNCNEAFAGKPDILAAKAAFDSNTDKIGDHLSQLIRPISTVRSPKQDSVIRMRKSLYQMIGIGLTLSTSQDNQPMMATFKLYNSMWKRCSAYQLHEISLHTHEELTKIQELASGNGLTEMKLAAFLQKVQDYGVTLDSTIYQLSDRRKSREELKDLITANHLILRMQLDTYVRYCEDDYPEFFSNYMFLRKRKPSKSSTDILPEPAEIAGTVTDSVTGFPVANATINIVEFGLIATTDADGCYIIDELEAGAYVVHCYANNYQVPEAVSFTAEAGESLVVDFSLVPKISEPPGDK